MVRERFTVAGSDRVATGVGVRLQRIQGTGSLVLRLEDSNGALLAKTNVAASAVPTGPSSGLGEASEWVTGSFPAPVSLKAGSSYRLRLSTDANTEFATWVIREGTSYGYHGDTYFDDGLAEKSSNGSSWSSLGRVSNQNDLQFYLATR